eukprot:4776800-Pleurochrysis_carterae.AAC.2
MERMYLTKLHTAPPPTAPGIKHTVRGRGRARGAESCSESERGRATVRSSGVIRHRRRAYQAGNGAGQ